MSTIENMRLARAERGTDDAVGRVAAPAALTSRYAAVSHATFDIVRDIAGLTALAPEWNGLFERAGAPHQVFQSYGFVELWARIYSASAAHEHAAGHPCDCELAIVTGRIGGRLVLVWPLVLQRKLWMRLLTALGDPVAQYADLLVDPSQKALPLMRAAFEHLTGQLTPDLVRLRRVRQDAAIAPLLHAIGTTGTAHAEAPFVTLGAASGSAGFEDRQSGKAKKNRRRLLRRLEEQGQVTFERLSGSERAAGLVEQALAAKRDWVVRRGLLAPALADERFDEVMRAAASRGADAAGCSVFSLSFDDRPVAIAVGFECKGRLMLHLISYVAEAEKLGAGVLNLESILRGAETRGLSAVDLLPPTADYKLQWADGAIPVADHALGLTMAGRIYTSVLDGFVKPLAKHRVDRLPLGLRQRLARGQFKLRSAASP